MTRVRIMAGEFRGSEASVVQDQRNGSWAVPDRVYVLIDGTDNPVPYKTRELEWLS